MFFFEKKNQKTFALWGRDLDADAASRSKRFLVLFYKKELLVSLRQMSQRQILSALHLFQPRGRTFESASAFARTVELVGRGASGGDEFHAVFVERVHEDDEAAGFVEIVGREARDGIEHEGVEVGGNGEVVAGAEWLAAEGIEFEAGDTFRGDGHGEAAALHHEGGGTRGWRRR